MTNETRGAVRPEQWVSVSAGAVLAAAGLRMRSWPGICLILTGTFLIYEGLCRLSCGQSRLGLCQPIEESWQRLLNWYGTGVNAGTFDQLAQASKEERNPAGTYIEDVVAEASDDSFPCSDPPAWTMRNENRVCLS